MPMFEKILSAFRAPEPEPLPEPDAKLALGALMVRVAKSDHEYHFQEISRIDGLIAKLNNVGPIEAAKMRAVCEKLEKQAPDTAQFAKLIHDNVAYEDRYAALEALWEVVLSDGMEKEEEVAVVNSTRAILGISEEDNQRAHDEAEGH